jgi:hypothetical protein
MLQCWWWCNTQVEQHSALSNLLKESQRTSLFRACSSNAALAATTQRKRPLAHARHQASNPANVCESGKMTIATRTGVS